MMKMRAKPWVLLTTTLMLAGSSGCAEGGPDTNTSDGQVSAVVDAGGQPPAGGSNDAAAVGPGPGPSGTTVPDAGSSTTSDAGPGSGGRPDAGPGATDKDAATTDASPVTPGAGGGTLPPTDSVDKDGPFMPTHIMNGGMKGTSWVFYPMDIGRNGIKHPIFNWGPGALTGPKEYTDHLNRLASHGFVVISQPSSGSGVDEKASLDWLIAQNDKSGSPFYQKLDTTKVGVGGHSLGALTTMKMAADPRLTMYILVCGGCMSGNGGCGAKDIHAPTVILGGDTDTGTPNFEGDYKEITKPVVFLTKSGTDHIACARNNLSPWVAFMRWQFGGEEQWKPKFFEGGEYCKAPWKCKNKNF